MKRFETLVIAIPDPTPDEQVEGQARRDREALVHALSYHPWLVDKASGDWRRAPAFGPLTTLPPLTLAAEPGSHGELAAAACRPRSAITSAGGGVGRKNFAQPEIFAQPDAVDHPAHYTSHPSGIDPIQITRFESFTRGNAIKYLMRAGRKDPDPRIDLRKARRYIDFELEDLDRQADTEASGAPVA